MRESITVHEVAARLFLICTDAEEIWADVRRLPKYTGSPLIACCEMMFGRLGIAKFMVHRTQLEPVAHLVCGEIDTLIDDNLGDSGDEETSAFYGAPLHFAAQVWVESYRQRAQLPLAVAACLMKRLGGPADSPAEVSRIVNEVGNQIGMTLSTFRVRAD